MEKRSKTTTELSRLLFIDWLRIFAVLLLFPFHSTRVFDIGETFYIHGPQTSAALTYIVIATLDVFHMPLFFFLAGASTWHALAFRSSKQYVSERFKRLFIPLVFGILVIIPPQSYLGALSKGKFIGSFWEYYPHFFRISPEGPSGYFGGWTPGHLWFILFLFFIALLALPLFLYLRKNQGVIPASLPGLGWILVPALLIFLSRFSPAPGGKNFIYYFVFFVFGCLIMAKVRFSEAVDRYKTWALALGAGSMLLLLVIALSGFPFPAWLLSIIDNFYPTLGCWLCLMAIWAYGKRFLNFHTPILPYLTQGVYAFYILHQTVIVILAYYVLKIPVALIFQWLIIIFGSITATLLIYDLLIRRVNLLRFLFGMKSKSRWKRTKRQIIPL
jgi:peptidoglycan/LPS O-acetylase OafA/YrhL